MKKEIRIYVILWVVLLLLVLLNWGLAQLNLGRFNVVATIAIAAAQMLLSIVFYMHVRISPRLTWIFVAAGFIWLMIMINLTLADYLTRGNIGARYAETWHRVDAPKKSNRYCVPGRSKPAPA
jgi:cytochrome c oxidase subunit 4